MKTQYRLRLSQGGRIEGLIITQVVGTALLFREHFRIAIQQFNGIFRLKWRPFRQDIEIAFHLRPGGGE